jgi:hypothetical protein
MKRLVSLSLGLAAMVLASPAFPFGIAGAPQFSGGGMVAGRVTPGSIHGLNVRLGGMPAVNLPGAVTVHGITLLPNGTMIVPAVTPRTHGSPPIVPPSVNNLRTPITPIEACPYLKCSR